MPAASAARAMPIASSDVVHGDGGDHVGLGLAEGRDLLRMIVLGLRGAHRRGRVVAVAARADAAGKHHRRVARFKLLAELGHQRDQLAVQALKLGRRQPSFSAQSRLARQVGLSKMKPAPSRARSRRSGGNRRAAARGLPRLHQVDRGEVRQVDPVDEDERRLQPAVGQEELAAKLREGVSVARYHRVPRLQRAERGRGAFGAPGFRPRKWAVGCRRLHVGGGFGETTDCGGPN